MSIIFLVYRDMSGVILDSQRIKNISQELLYTNTYIQNIADKSDIKIDTYTNDTKDKIIMKDNLWFEYIVGRECSSDGKKCWIYSETQQDGKTKLTNSDSTYLLSLNFVIIPFDPIPEDKSINKQKIKNIYSRGFWMMTEMLWKKTDITKPIYTQSFFSVRSY